jgi:hypothetical protein
MMLKKILITAGVIAACAAPAQAVAAPTKAEKRAAKADCRAERADQGVEVFRETYGINGNKRNAFGKCVSAKVKEAKQDARHDDGQEEAAEDNAAKTCAAERDELGKDAFGEQYGTGPNNRNAFGKCVSAVSGADREDEEEESAPAP